MYKIKLKNYVQTAQTDSIEKTSNRSPEIIRQHWNQYALLVDQSSQLYLSLWDDWCRKYGHQLSDPYIQLFKKFIEEKTIIQTSLIMVTYDTLVLKGLNSDEREELHILCDQIGLHHQSIKAKKHKRHLYIYRPPIWLWEFSEKNPCSQPPEYYENLRKQKKERWSQKYCCVCDKNGWETQLLCSVYFRGLYCEECLEETSDGDGGVMSDHKFEPYKF